MDREMMCPGAVLVASTDRSFAAVVGQMIVDAGFRAELVTDDEPAWSALVHGEPRVAICDGGPGGKGLEHVVDEAVAHGIPVLVFRSERAIAAAGTPGISYLSFPVSAADFTAALDRLLRPPTLHIVPRALLAEIQPVDPRRSVAAQVPTPVAPTSPPRLALRPPVVSARDASWLATRALARGGRRAEGQADRDGES